MAEEEKTPVEIANERLAELEEKSEGQLEGLANKLTGAFWDKLKEVFYLIFAIQWEDVGVSWEKALTNATKDMVERHFPDKEKDVADFIEKIQATTFDPAQGMRELQAYADVLPGLGSILKLVFLLLAATGVVKANLGAAWELGAQTVQAMHRPSLLPFDATIEAFYKDPTSKPEIKDILDRMGISDEFQEILWVATEAPLDILSAREAFLRNEIDEVDHDSILKSHHLSDVDISTMKKLYELIPPVTDIITMAVREVFTPEIVERFGQMQDLPPEFVEWASQKGLSDYWAKAYWAAHWALPSILQGFEMLHRRVIDQSDLDLLLRALDVMPFWRDKLTAISFRPLTRVDVRRMHRIGVLDEDAVFDAYRDVGYDDYNAGLMTEFTVAFNMQRDRDLSKTDVVALYKKAVIKRDTAQTMLIALGYSEIDAGMILQRADFEVYAASKKERVGYIKTAYIAGKIAESAALSRLGQLDMPSAEVDTLMESWELARRSKVKDLSLDNLKAFFKEKVITVDELTVELTELGYSARDVGRFVSLFGKEATA